MAAATLISLEEYLRTTYEPDCDFVDGVVEERNLGEWSHSTLQTVLIGYLCESGTKVERSRTY